VGWGRVAVSGAVIAVLAGAAVAIAVDEPQSDDDPVVVERPLPGGIPTLAGALFGPGTPIASGYTVADGSYLVGRAFPQGLDQGRGSWVALILVTGRPQRVLSAYVAQAEAHGLHVSDTELVGYDGCSTSGTATEWCTFTRSADDSGHRTTLELRYSRGMVSEQPTSMLEMRLLPYGPRGSSGVGEPGQVALPRSWPPLPGTGEPLSPPHPEGAKPVRVVAGTEPVAPAWRFGPEGCALHAWVIRVNDGLDAEAAFDAYVTQLDGSVEEGDDPFREVLADGTLVRYEPRSIPTVFARGMTLVRPPSGSSWILYEGCG
jgi:hypothetical protein